jgi:hypothetical protein
MSAFCSLEEAFALAVPSAATGKSSKKHRTKVAGGGRELFSVPVTTPSTPDPDRQAQIQPAKEDVLGGPPDADGGGGAPSAAAANVIVTGGVKLDDMFPLPGDTGDADEWEKAFTLPGSRMPAPAPGAVSVDGKSTLWRQIPAPLVAPPAPLPIGSPDVGVALAPAELSARLDALTRQLESLTTPAPLQSTAELFLFVAIGLLVLLAIDTLLRFAVRMASGTIRMAGGGRRFGGHYGGRFGYRSKWY